MTNRADQRKFHILYKTTCLTTGKWYIGIHSTDNLNDGYKGSGEILWKSIKKHGQAVHIWEILEYHDTRKALADREKELLTKEFRKDPMCMNIAAGGQGEYSGKALTEDIKKKVSDGLKVTFGNMSVEQRKKLLGRPGKKRSEETKARMCIASKKNQSSPEVIAKKSEKQRQAMNAPGMKEKLSTAQAIARARPEVRANIAKAKMKPCTDGIHVYPSKAAFISALGKKALKSPDFRFLPKSVV